MKLPGRLGSLQARDVMSTEVFLLTENMTLLDASEQLKKRKHSGAPVVDSQGRLVGTFSLRDLTGVKKLGRPKENQADGSSSRQSRADTLDSGIISAEALKHIQQNALALERVSERMTRNAPSVTENATLIDVARLMCHFHTHRIPVTSANSQLTGIITTMDVLAALVHTADELQ
ncbi:CBS domain-containing protein [bacterium]|uniref:CBS domain containing protein n=1 Tax=Rubinisphaera brasiliensis (strain ATCC 49424 / DSM 5305 / JCM 21570 / IAM 15109 / NBRC 103401 / IFAM 1448) TaxID=756272 RepID=F0SK24_RUBBR|nr:CBS domain-containing protein [Rubinisphaera brasiliensis]ADY59751.1 CBS domain containing protein [Rubinisphaera brasiliensis DSM 5305]MBB01786.1 CBS domain-containing protein [Planctomyces sp.]MBR9801784.1 CBS domain-containing protein [bacterium]